MVGFGSDITFVHKNVSNEDIELFLGPFEDDERETILTFEDNQILAHLMHMAERFPSVGQARKNGWDKPIPEGFSRFQIGKGDRMKIIWILNVF